MEIHGLKIKRIGHDTFQICGKSTVIYTDPYKLKEAELADIILVSHEHSDHCDGNAIAYLCKADTEIVGSKGAIKKLNNGKAISAGESTEVKGVKIKAVQAYNINKFRGPGVPFHTKDLGVGFVFEVDGVKLYFAGDTDNIPEMAKLANENIDIALLPISGVYVMTEEEAAEAVKAIKPKTVIPMHYGTLEGVGGDVEKFKKLAGGLAEVKVL